MDRYEWRGLGSRKFAIWAFDAGAPAKFSCASGTLFICQLIGINA
jgi:hypothetical protein